ncbi:proline-serine-threonine phosphatase-interacting protein 1b [Chanos chanos]|uniref:Proline-serine-threonine phosphatase-interacting protein 1b n=1 Tax=Chanos chanos TaxID=29144 RepID=A0A6J2UNY8_CHACN|nr:proline-serine-threonine phosphatase-interacting protein 1-like [Chanos chanos]
MAQLQFCDAFWGTDFTDHSGYEAILQRLNEGRRMCKDVEELLRMRATAEERYGRDLVTIARKAGGQAEISTLKASFDQLKAQIENTGNLHIELAGMLKEEIQKVEAFRERQKEQRKKLEEIMEKVQKSKVTLYKKTMESKRCYEQRCKEADEAEQAAEKRNNDSPSNLRQSEKVQNKARLCRQAANLAEKQHTLNIDQLEKTRQDWESTHRSTCEVFQQQESDRISMLRCVLWDHCNMLSMQCIKDDDCHEEVRKTLEKCDITVDKDFFISVRKTGLSPPEPIKFQSYYERETNGSPGQAHKSSLTHLQQEATGGSRSSINNWRSSVAPSSEVLVSGRDEAGGWASTQLPERTREADRDESVDQYMVIYDYTAQDNDELSITKGEFLVVTDKGEDGWWTAHKGNMVGLVPGTYLAKV